MAATPNRLPTTTTTRRAGPASATEAQVPIGQPRRPSAASQLDHVFAIRFAAVLSCPWTPPSLGHQQVMSVGNPRRTAPTGLHKGLAAPSASTRPHSRSPWSCSQRMPSEIVCRSRRLSTTTRRPSTSRSSPRSSRIRFRFEEYSAGSSGSASCSVRRFCPGRHRPFACPPRTRTRRPQAGRR